MTGPGPAGTGSGFWGQLTAAEAEDLRRAGRTRQFRRGEVIFRQADRLHWVLVLLAGRVKVSSYAAGGGEVVLGVREPGTLLGELSAIDREPRSATVTALEAVTALVVPAAEFERYLAAHGRVAILLMRTVTARLRDADRKRIEFGTVDTTARVAARLVELAERFGEPAPGGIRISMPLSQDELAGWTGASREAVSKALGVLRTRGWIETSRLRVVVRDLAALRARAG